MSSASSVVQCISLVPLVFCAPRATLLLDPLVPQRLSSSSSSSIRQCTISVTTLLVTPTWSSFSHSWSVLGVSLSFNGGAEWRASSTTLSTPLGLRTSAGSTTLPMCAGWHLRSALFSSFSRKPLEELWRSCLSVSIPASTDYSHLYRILIVYEL